MLKIINFKFVTTQLFRFSVLFAMCSAINLAALSRSHAAQIIFFKSYSASGAPIIFEGVYSHAAISFQGQWLHAHPRFGIQLVPGLDRFGPHFKILENLNYPEPTPEFVEEQLKKKFNIFARWNDNTETYCSKLVGQALRMTPTKMHFQSKDWQHAPQAMDHRGQLGLSPSDIYWHARRKLNFKSVKPPEPKIEIENSCDSFL